MGVSSANCVSGFPLPLSFPVPTGSVSWEAFHPLALAVRVLRGFGFRFWTFPLGCSIAATRPPFSLWGLRPCALCARSFRRLGVLCRFRICGVCASKRIPTSEFSLDLESRFADFRVLGPSRWLPVDGESVRTRFPPGSIAFWRLRALVLCFCLCPPKFCASRFGKKQVYGKRVPVVFCLVFQGPPPRLCRHCARGSDLSAMPVSFNCGFLPAFWMFASSASFGPLPLALFAPSRPRRKSSDFRVSS